MKTKQVIHDKYDESRPITSNSSSASSSSSSSSEKGSSDVYIKTVTTAPDGGWGWVVCVASFLCFVVLDGMLFTYGVFYVEFLNYFEAGKGKTALVGSVFMGMSLFFGPFTSAMVNMWGLRFVSMTGAVIAAASFASSVFAPNLEVLTFTYGFMGGLGVAMVYIPSILVVGFYFDKKRAFANGITSSGSGFGTFIFSPLCSYLIDTYSWKGALLILSGVMLNCLVFCSLYRPLKAIKIVADIDIDKEICDPGEDEYEAGYDDDNNSFMRLNGKIIKIPEIHLSVSSILNAVDEKKQSTHDVTHKKPHQDDLLRLIHTKRQIEMIHSTQNVYPNLSDSPYANPNICRSQNFNTVKPTSQIPEKLYNSTINVFLHNENTASAHHYKSPVYCKEITLNPLDKKDIFYSGSLQRIGSCSLHNDKQISDAEIGLDDCEDNVAAELEPHSKKHKGCLDDDLNKLIGLNLFTLPSFWLIVTAMCMWTTHSTILTILPHFTSEQGVSDYHAANVLSAIGLSNIVARIVAGAIVNHGKMSSICVNVTALLVGGVSCLLLPYAPNHIAIFVLAVVFGCCMATWTSLRPLILVDVLGLDNLTNTFGMVAMFQGLAFSIGPPIAGILYDVTGSYTLPLFLAGSAFITSGLLFVILSKLRRCLSKK